MTPIRRREFLKTVGAAAVSVAITGSYAATGDQAKPNVAFILADDMGYGDISSLNAESLIPTPNIDRITNAGIYYADAHSPSALCTPTRYEAMTGLMCPEDVPANNSSSKSKSIASIMKRYCRNCGHV